MTNYAFEDSLEWQALKTGEWVEFDFSHFRVAESDFTEAERTHAVETVSKMLAASYWFAPIDFFHTFVLWGENNKQTSAIAAKYKQSLLTEGWQGIPIVSFLTISQGDKVSLHSGHHRFLALHELFVKKQLQSGFKIPVFDINALYPVVRARYRDGLNDAMDYLSMGNTLGEKFALREIADNYFISLCTGIDI